MQGYPDQFPVLEGDGLDLLTLALVLDAPEDNPVPGDLTFQGKGVQVDLPEAVGVGAEHSIDRRLQLCEGAVAVRFFDLPDDDQVRALVCRIGQFRYVVLGDIHRLPRTGGPLQNAVAAAPFVDRAKDRVKLGRRPELNCLGRSHN